MSALAWIYLIVMARSDGSDANADVDGRDGADARVDGMAEFALMLAMWVVMMIGMMLPTAVPMTLVYAAVGRKAAREGTSIAPTAAFVFGVRGDVVGVQRRSATLAQWALDRAALLSPMLVTTSPALGGGLLIAAGLYQWTPYKEACLRHCRSARRSSSRSTGVTA